MPAAVSVYCQIAGCASSHHGTTLARNDPAGTAPAMMPAARQHTARRARRRGPAPQKTSPTPANTARSTSAYAQKNTVCVLAHTGAAVSCPASPRTAEASGPRAAAVTGAPGSPPGRG